jgi:hypothetical protein
LQGLICYFRKVHWSFCNIPGSGYFPDFMNYFSKRNPVE